jgi:hypothetical protein
VHHFIQNKYKHGKNAELGLVEERGLEKREAKQFMKWWRQEFVTLSPPYVLWVGNVSGFFDKTTLLFMVLLFCKRKTTNGKYQMFFVFFLAGSWKSV